MRAILEHAKYYEGLSEIPGKKHNPTIVEWAKSLKPWVSDDETPWCTTFVNVMLRETGFSGTGQLNARSFLDWGQPTYTPEPGNIVVLWRESPSSWKGHVAFFEKFETLNGTQGVRLFGGNQNNKVSSNWYPLSRVIGYRKVQL